MLVLNNDGFLLTVREFVEWEYNGGRGDFQPDTTFRTWNSLPVDTKIGYVACSVYGDVVGESSLLIKVGNKTYLLHEGVHQEARTQPPQKLGVRKDACRYPVS